MADTLASIVKEAKRNKYSLIKSLSEDEIVSIWECASVFVEKQMLLQKGVTIPGLGVFTFSQKKIDVGSNKFIVIQRPVFVLSEKFAQTHSLHITKQHTAGQIPIVPLNFTVLSNDSPFNRDTVEMCIRDILLSLSRSLATKKSIQLDFGKVGRLLVNEGRVKMRFFRDFVTSLDSSGGLENTFRPDTTDSILSIMSNPGTPRPSTSATLILPRIVEPSGINALNLECITPRPTTSGSTKTPESTRITFDYSTLTDESQPTDSIIKTTRTPRELVSEEIGKLSPLRSSCSGKHCLVPKPAMLFATKDQAVGGKKLSPLTTDGQLQAKLAEVKWRPSSSSCSTTSRSSTTKSLRENDELLTSKPQFAICPSTCSHSTPSGQELCYLCHQRAQRNFPVDVIEERKERERMDDQMLQEYQYQKDLIALTKEISTKSKNQAYSKDIASLNLDIAIAQKAHRTAKSSEFHPSYVFPQREATPAKHFKQTDYCSQLDSQVHRVQSQRHKAQELEDRLEREEQIKLSEELAAYQKQYTEQKAKNVSQYQRALAEQISLKPAHLLAIETPGNSIKQLQQQPVFGVHDLSSDKMKEEKERSRKLFLEQLNMAAAKQQMMSEKALLTQQEEAEMLKQTRKGLIDDIRADKRCKLESRKSLEKSWNNNTKEKHERALEELSYSKQPSLLVQQQCDKYLRCQQCQRTRGNNGKSNLMCETRYISGARLMV